jgi:hypothetical protein
LATEIKQSTTIGIEINKNPFLLSGEGIDSAPQTFTTSILPSNYVARDFISKKNYLGLFIEHEMKLSDLLSLNFEGTFDVVISDTTDIPELPSVEPVENNNFYPELSLDYELHGFYTYTDASVSEDEVITVESSVTGVPRHSGAFWTSYEITQGVWQGLGFGSGIFCNGSRFEDVENSFTLPR